MNLFCEAKNIELSSRLKRNLSQMSLTTDLFEVLLQNAFEKLTDARPKAPKRPRRSLAPSTGRKKECLDSTWQLILLVLEEIHHRSYFQRAELLVPFYFKVLKCCSDDSSAVPSVEYVKQLTIGCLLNVTTALADGTAKGTILPKDFSVELIINCIRNSEDHHTHQLAHLVLGKAAVLFPDLVLHNMMAIFTFMGSSMLRQDDSYSFEVLKKTVSTVVPVLIGTESSNLPVRARERQVQEISKLVVGVFADAAPYIPNHRRLMLFSHLTEVLGAAKNLHVVLALLLTRAVTKSKRQTATELPKEELLSEEFCVNLTLQFPPKVVMAAIGRLMKTVTLLVTRESNAGDENVVSDDQEEDFVLSDLRSQSVKDLRYFVYLAVSITSKVLANAGFRTQIQSLQAEDPKETEEAYLSLLKELLLFVKEEGRLIDDKEPESVVKFRKAIIHKGCSIIDKIDDGLKFETFVRVFKTLTSNDSLAVQTKAIELVTEKVLKIRELSDSQKKELLPLVNILINVIRASQSQSQDHMHAKKTALVALKALSSRFGPTHAQKFLDSLPAILECCKEAGQFSHFNAHALLCMADFCVAFPVQIIGKLQDIVPHVMKNLTVSSSARENFVPHSAFAGAVKIVEAIPQFLSPYTSKFVEYSALIDMDTVSVPPPIQEKARELRLALGANIAPRILLPALDKCLDAIEQHHKMYVSFLMEILAECLLKTSNADVQTHIKSFHSIFIKSLQLRAQRRDLPPDEVVQLEQRVVDVYCGHVMKLSENSFRPLFWKVFAWATESGAPYDRVISFFHLCCGLAEKLKSLFLLFAKQVMKTAKETLEKFHGKRLGDLPLQQHPHAESISSQLIELILTCLSKCFVYDRMGFTSKEDFDFLVDTLVDQIDNDFGSPELYHKRIEQSLTPCIRSFTTVVHDESCWKVINSRVLLKTKDKRPKVRIASLHILGAVQSALKESYASLLPETIPCLAELMEDENAEVEKKCQEIISQIEASLGESLQKYF